MDYTIIFVVIVIIALGIADKLIDKKKGINKEEEVPQSPYRYRAKNFLVSKPEHEFFDVLVASVGDLHYVFPQIHLATILDHKINGQKNNAAFRHINGKSVDYVLCDKATIKPLLAIELDDRSHEYKNRKDRDKIVEGILKEAGLPLLRFENHGNFNKEEIKSSVLQILENK